MDQRCSNWRINFSRQAFSFDHFSEKVQGAYFLQIIFQLLNIITLDTQTHTQSADVFSVNRYIVFGIDSFFAHKDILSREL